MQSRVKMGLAFLVASGAIGALTGLNSSPDTRATFIVFSVLFGLMGLLSFAAIWQRS